jgi:hypothetical protein
VALMPLKVVRGELEPRFLRCCLFVHNIVAQHCMLTVVLTMPAPVDSDVSSCSLVQAVPFRSIIELGNVSLAVKLD